MEIEKTVQAMLRLGKEWEVSSCEYEPEAQTFFIVIQETAALWAAERCPKDGGEVLVAKRVLFATPGKDAGVWKDFADELIKHNGHPHAVTQVSIDMSPAYRRGVEDNFRNAKMVFDKFHVIQHCGEAVDAVRRLESNLDAGRKQALKESRWIWLKNPENLTEGQKQRLGRIDRDCLWTSKAYQMRLGLQNIYQMPRSLAKKRFGSWCRWVKKQAAKAPNNLLDSMVKVAEMIERHLEGILEHWTAGITNAFLEGLNSLFSATKRKARGYRTTRYFIAMLYFVAAKLNIPSILNPLFH